jgi:hypothetical protein
VENPCRTRLHFAGGTSSIDQIRPAAICAMMAGDQIDRRGIGGLAAFAAQAAEQGLEGHVALPFEQQPHRIADRTAATMQTVQFDHARRPV